VHCPGSQLVRLAGGVVEFVEFAVLDCDDLVPFMDGGFQFGDLGVFGPRHIA
jgi:hypothetical protein